MTPQRLAAVLAFLGLVGAACVVAGIALLSVPVALVTAGVALVALAAFGLTRDVEMRSRR